MSDWWNSHRWRRPMRLWGPVLAIAAISIAAALISWAFINHGLSEEERAERVADMGDFAGAERMHWKLVQQHPDDLTSWLTFIDSHAAAVHSFDEPGSEDEVVVASSVGEKEIRSQLAKIRNRDVALLASFWYDWRITPAKADPVTLIPIADRARPARLANQILGRVEWKKEHFAESARRFEREGFAFPEFAERNLRHAVAIWAEHDMWDQVRRCSKDPRYSRVADATLRLELAEHDHDWPAILRWLWPASFVDVGVWPIALALLAGILWFSIAARLGRFTDGVHGRRRLYVLSFVLGVISVYPTLVSISIEESIFGFKEMGQALPDLIYFVFGVGLREELCKLLLFLPLVPLLLRRGSRIEAMTCGALVGLGFAAEENVQYFRELSAGAAIGRFLTANFLHMALTSIVALSVFDTLRGRQTSRDGFNVIFPLAVALHGAYDFLLTSDDFPLGSFVAMALLFVLCRAFLRQLSIASRAVEMQSLLRLFVWSLTLLTGVSYVYATTLVGPLLAIELVAMGVLGVSILIYLFVRELSEA